MAAQAVVAADRAAATIDEHPRPVQRWSSLDLVRAAFGGKALAGAAPPPVASAPSRRP